MAISEERMDELSLKYKDKKGFLIPLLQEIQNEEGYLSKETIKQISKIFSIKTAEIFGVASFYSMFRLRPVGKHIIKVCKGTACHVLGADDIIFSIRSTLGLKDEAETTEDGIFTVIEVACLGCCSLAPAIMIDTKIFGNLTTDKIEGILRKYNEKN